MNRPRCQPITVSIRQRLRKHLDELEFPEVAAVITSSSLQVSPDRASRFRRGALWTLLLLTGQSIVIDGQRASAPTLTVSLSQSVVTVNEHAEVLVTARPSALPIVAASVQLVALSGGGRPSRLLGTMHDDGSDGDALAGDNVFTLRVRVFETSVTQLVLAVAAAFQGSGRIVSEPVTIQVWPAVVEPVLGVRLNRPPDWHRQADRWEDVLYISNVAAYSDSPDALDTESVFRVQRRRGANPLRLAVSDWVEQVYERVPGEPLLNRKMIIVDGRASLYSEAIEIDRYAHVFIPVGDDIFEVAYELRNDSFFDSYTQTLSSLRFSESEVSSLKAQPASLYRAIGSSASDEPVCADPYDAAKEQVDVVYTSGGKANDDTPGLDCSGLVNVAYPLLPDGRARDQAASELLSDKMLGPLEGLIQSATLERGDLLFFDTDSAQTGDITHVGIYDGNGKMISAVLSRGVIEQNLLTAWGGYWLKTGTYFDNKEKKLKGYGNFKFARRFKTPPCPKRHPLTVVIEGPGHVTSSPAGIDCPETCLFEFQTGSTIVLEANPDADAVFEGWSGDCTGTGGCTVLLGTAKVVTARFRPSKDFQIEGQNRVRLVGSWRIVFVNQEDNFALTVRTVEKESAFRIDEDDPLLPPIEIRDSEPSGWTVDVSDWGDDPGQAYIEDTMLDANTYLVSIEVTHGSPNRPYDDAVLRFERITSPKEP